MSASVKSLPAPRLPAFVLALAACALALAVLFADGLAEMAQTWLQREEYSHGPLIPALAAFLAWRQRTELLREQFEPAMSGVLAVLAAALLNLLGGLASVFVLQQYAFVLALCGLVASAIGWRGVRVLWAPLLILLLMIPLPNFVLNNLSSQLQLVSSQLGVAVIRAFDISVFVEGNVIDLGGYRLQVAEACDGLRYLFPLLTLSFIMAYLFQVKLWKRLVLFLSAVPLTIAMNSLRVGMIGIMVEHWGTRMAEGFLHEFQGWAVFMCSAALLLLEMMVLARVGRDKAPWRTVFGFQPQPAAPADTRVLSWRMPRPFIAGAVLLAVIAATQSLVPTRAERVPQRESFVSFPARLETWVGRRSALEQVYLDVLKLDDYLLADFSRSQEVVNLYVAWYDSQRAGQSAHSPRSCLPGGGWRITSHRQIELPQSAAGAAPLRANRVQIELGSQKQLVYYWFQQRGRVITNEYLVKWYLFWDSLTRRRSDGALVRLVTPLRDAEAVEQADARLASFIAQAAPRLAAYVPD